MELDPRLLESAQLTAYRLRALYDRQGYRCYRMSKFEEYDLYSANKDFLESDRILTFTDTTGRLMALKPDVTLSIIKNTGDCPRGLRRLYYNENVYRAAEDGEFKEIPQTGLECIGQVDAACEAEVLTLACESLALLGTPAVLQISRLDLLSRLIDALSEDISVRRQLMRCAGEKNLPEMEKTCRAAGIAPERLEPLKQLLSLCGSPEEIWPALESLAAETGSGRELEELKQALTGCRPPEGVRLQLDFSLIDNIHYYSGMIFQGFVAGCPDSVLSGGRYDRLMRKMRCGCGGIGFAVYLDRAEARQETTDKERLLNIALPKGRLGERVYGMFEKAGLGCPGVLEDSRKLFFENPETGVRYFWVKPSDVAIYVERGAADIGVAGKDILLEYRPNVYELLDLNTGKCRMAVAGPADFRDAEERPLRVATKFSHIARKYYQSRGRDIDIIHLNGSIELAPVLGLSDVIVDIVETGKTLQENGLAVLEEILPISARLIANKTSYRFAAKRLEKLTEALARCLEEET